MKTIATAYQLLLLSVGSIYAQKKSSEIDLEKVKAEVKQMELDFSAYAGREGLAAAFYTYAAEDAVINRGGKIVQGKEAIRTFYDRDNYKTAKLVWAPDFVEVAASGDLAYTYGKFTFTSVAPDGKEIKNEGIFHSVWKRQKDGKWKFVYD